MYSLVQSRKSDRERERERERTETDMTDMTDRQTDSVYTYHFVGLFVHVQRGTQRL